MTADESIFEEAMDDLKESSQRIRAVQNRLRAAGMDTQGSYHDLLTYRVSAALVAMAEAAYVEARRRSKRAGA